MLGPAWIQYGKKKSKRKYTRTRRRERGGARVRVAMVGEGKKREREKEEKGFGEGAERNGYLNKMKKGGTTDKKGLGGVREATDGTKGCWMGDQQMDRKDSLG